MQQRPKEASENIKKSSGNKNTKGDVDCKFFYLPRFIELAAQGQPAQLEMLFAPKDMILYATDEWNVIQENIELFKSKKGITPFVGFALAQAYKATIKGENLRLIRELISILESVDKAYLDKPIRDAVILGDEDSHYLFPNNVKVNKKLADDGKTEVIEIAGRKFNLGLATKKLLKTLRNMEQKYGNRVKAAAKQKYDFKSLGHAVRLLNQAEEFLKTGEIIFPRPDADFIKTILKGEVDKNFDWLDYIVNRIDNLRDNIKPISSLPEEPNWKKLNQLCINLQGKIYEY